MYVFQLEKEHIYCDVKSKYSSEKQHYLITGSKRKYQYYIDKQSHPKYNPKIILKFALIQANPPYGYPVKQHWHQEQMIGIDGSKIRNVAKTYILSRGIRENVVGVLPPAGGLPTLW